MSYVKIKKDRIIEACDAYISDMNKRRDEDRIKFLSKFIKPKTWYRWNPLKSIEEAEQYVLEKTTLTSRLEYRMILYNSNGEIMVRRLLTAALVSDDEMMDVHADVAHELGSYLIQNN